MAVSRPSPSPGSIERGPWVSADKSVRYYCEFCGSLVRLGDRICPHCGSFFNQVRCPACQFQGEAHLFRQGCPVCGFAKNDPPEKAPAGRGKKPAAGGKKPGYEVAYVIDEARKPAAKSAMPAWVPVLLVVVFVIVVVTAAILAKG